MDILKQINMAIFAVAVGGYSGITSLGDNSYAIVDDRDEVDGYKVLKIDMDMDNGKITDIQYQELEGWITRKNNEQKSSHRNRDCEGVAFCKDRNSVFIAGEADQEILEYSLDGTPTGSKLFIPSYFSRKNIVPNYGFESLAYNEKTKLFWTTTETTLLRDGNHSNVKNRNVENYLRLQSFGIDLQPKGAFAYKMDLPVSQSGNGRFVFGVSDIIALDDGRLFVMEREVYVPKLYLGSTCWIKIYEVNPDLSLRINDNDVLANLSEKQFLNKKLVTQFKTGINVFRKNFANYEGMCLGPRLNDGRQTIILVADSQGRFGNSVYHLKDYIRVIVLDN